MVGNLKDKDARLALGTWPPFFWSPRCWHLCAPCRPARERSQAVTVIGLTQPFPSGCSSEE